MFLEVLLIKPNKKLLRSPPAKIYRAYTKMMNIYKSETWKRGSTGRGSGKICMVLCFLCFVVFFVLCVCFCLCVFLFCLCACFLVCLCVLCFFVVRAFLFFI